jgi:hypothetical protein
VKQKLFNAGSEVVTNSPDAFARAMRTDMERINRLVKVAGLSAD